jgi:hypothetical protein
MQRHMTELVRVKALLVAAAPGTPARGKAQWHFNKQSTFTQSLFPDHLSAAKSTIVNAPESMFAMPAADVEDSACYHRTMDAHLVQLAQSQALFAASLATLNTARERTKTQLHLQQGAITIITTNLHDEH